MRQLDDGEKKLQFNRKENRIPGLLIKERLTYSNIIKWDKTIDGYRHGPNMLKLKRKQNSLSELNGLPISRQIGNVECLFQFLQ